MHLASLSRVNFGTRSLRCENSEMGYSFPYSMLCLARLEQSMRPPFFFCFLLPLQYSGLVCHILRLDHDSHQPHNTKLKEQHVRLFLFPIFAVLNTLFVSSDAQIRPGQNIAHCASLSVSLFHCNGQPLFAAFYTLNVVPSLVKYDRPLLAVSYHQPPGQYSVPSPPPLPPPPPSRPALSQLS